MPTSSVTHIRTVISTKNNHNMIISCLSFSPNVITVCVGWTNSFTLLDMRSNKYIHAAVVSQAQCFLLFIVFV